MFLSSFSSHRPSVAVIEPRPLTFAFVSFVQRRNWNTYSINLDCSQWQSVIDVTIFNGQMSSIGKLLVNTSTASQRSRTVTLYPHFMAQKGVYLTVPNIYSPQLHNTRDIVVYLPPSLLENGLRPSYPTLVAHDGQNMFNDSTSFAGSWRLSETLDNLIGRGKMEEVIVVAVDNTVNRTAELTYSIDMTELQPAGAEGNLYLDFIRDTVLPTIAKKYPISTSVEDVGILGSSLGGLISCYAGWTRPKEYSRVACMSSSFWWNSEDFDRTVMVQSKPPPFRTVFYLDSGNTGPLRDDLEQTIRVLNHMEYLGWAINTNLYHYIDDGAGHNEEYWRKRVWIPLSILFPIEAL